MAKDKFDWTSQLVMLRGMTQRLGILHEAQCLQIRLWPFTVDPTLDKAEARVDIEAKRVEFVWSKSTLKIDKKYEERLQFLSDSVKFLLGDEWSISINLDGAAIFPFGYKNVERSNRSRSGKPKPDDKSKRVKSKRSSKKRR